MCGGGTVLGRVATGITNTFTDPRKAVTAVATLGTSAIVEENKKGAASAAAGAAGAFVTSGGNPFAAAAGAVAGTVSAATNKRDIADSAFQSAAYGAAVGGVFSVAGAVSAKMAASSAAKAKAANDATIASLGAWNNPALLGTNVAATAPSAAVPGIAGTVGSSGGFLASVGGAIAKGAGAVAGGAKGVLVKAAEVILPAAIFQKLTGRAAGGMSEYYEKSERDYIRDGAITAGIDPNMVPGAAGGGGDEGAGGVVNVMGAAIPVWVAYGSVTIATVYALYQLWKNRKAGAGVRARTA